MTPSELCPRIRKAYELGHYVQAYELGRAAWGIPVQWPGTDARVLALRLASNLGAPRLADWLTRSAYHHDPGHSEATYYEGRRQGRRRGPYDGYRWLRRAGELPEATTPDVRSSWYALWGEFASQLRDFDTAETWFRQAEAADPGNPWIKVCWASSREKEDRYDEALALAREALAMRPMYRPAAQALGHLLMVEGRDEEAVEFLAEAACGMECFALYAQLVTLQIELKRYADARHSLDRIEQLAVLAEKPLPQWLAGNRGEVAYFLGDLEASIRCSRESDSKFWKTVADRLENPAYAGAKATTLAVGFVRQHHATCAPATLSAISRYWGMPADHLQVADEICYNGTSAYSERKWAGDHGWVAREFSVTETSAQELLDRGIPFTFTTVDPGNSHLQAVIGYDGRRGTLVIRDPYWRTSGEAITAQLLERYRSSGPRGMAMAPQSRAELLAQVDLPDAAIWDRLHALDRALVEHRRDAAQREYAALVAAEPEHRLAWEARRRLAIYDGNATEHLSAVDRLVRAFPDDQRLELERLSLLRHQARREERLATYERLCAKPESHPIFWQQYAQELRADARRWDDAIWLLRRAIARWPSEAANYVTLAYVYWDQRRFDEALELHRIAACLGDKDEQIVMAYFSAADWFKQTDAALRLLRDRFDRFGKKSSDPARSLSSAYVQLERYGEALGVIEEALALRPDDGELLLYAADLYSTSSSEYLPRVRDLVEAARGKAPRAAWIRTAARLAVADDRTAEALTLWREALELSPLSLDAHTAVARLLFALEGDAVAQRHLADACARFPHHIPLHELWVEWIRDEPPEVREPIIRRLIDVGADNAWAHRELGFLLASQQRCDEAWRECEIAGRLEPTCPPQYLLRARLLRATDRLDEAKRELRAALEASIDNDNALAAWMELCETMAERRGVLEFFQEQLEKQVIFGDGLLAFREHAANTLEPQELLQRLRDAQRQRPDLWHAWSALVLQLLDVDQLDEAWQVAREATDRFPLLPSLWLDRAEVCRARLDWPAEQEALENAYRINPSWGTTVRRWCESLNQRGENAKSVALLAAAVARQPNDGATRTLLAETQWQLDQCEAAVESARTAVKLDPGQSRGWDLLQQWSDERGCPEVPRATARELAARRPGDARSWLILARILDRQEETDERLAAYDRAIGLSPRNSEAYDLKAETLAACGRFDEASAACRPAIFGEFPPTSLRGRAAWIAAERGELQTAIARMREVLDEEPYYYWGWSRLADWCQAAQDLDGYLDAAQALVRLSPQYEVSLAYLGEARLLKGDRDGAREAFERAYELNPRYEFAGTQLFDLHFADGRLDEAAEVLERLESFVEGNLVAARAVQLAAKRGQQEVALTRLRQIALSSERQPWPLDKAVEALVDAGWSHDARWLFERMVLAECPGASVAQKWVELACHAGPEPLDAQLRQLARRAATEAATESAESDGVPSGLQELGRVALRTYLGAFVNRKDPDGLKRFTLANESWIRQDATYWGLIGWAWTSLRDYAEAAAWMRDWPARTDARPWALVNAAEALRNTNRDREGADCSRFALTLAASNGLHLHHLWLAVDSVLTRDLQATRDLLHDADEVAQGESLDEDYAFLRVMIESLLDLESARPDQRIAIFHTVAPRLNQARLAYTPFRQEPARQRFYRRVLRRMAACRGGITGWLWYVYWMVRAGF